MTACHRCNGTGTVPDALPPPRAGFVQCWLCGGKGERTPQQAKWWKKALAHVTERAGG